MGDNKHGELVKNRSAFHHYEISDKFEAGLSLLGTEVKSLKDSGGSLAESYIKVVNEELWLINAHIAHYKHGNVQNHDERRERKLLMHKREILRLKSKVQEKGVALVPLSLYLYKGRVKLSLGLGVGKKMHDKRESTKARDVKRQVQRELKEY